MRIGGKKIWGNGVPAEFFLKIQLWYFVTRFGFRGGKKMWTALASSKSASAEIFFQVTYLFAVTNDFAVAQLRCKEYPLGSHRNCTTTLWICSLDTLLSATNG